MGKSLSMRIHYHTHENSTGQCILWCAAATKTQLRELLERHRISVDKVFKFEVNKGHGYEEKDVQKLIEMVKE